MIFQILLIAFALFAITITTKQYRLRKVSLYWFISWTLLWTIVIVVALIPQATDPIAQLVGIERGADLLVYVAIVVLSYGLYRVLVRLEKVQKEITQVVRQVAINKAEKSKGHE
ncbi:DUF2304 domain-containing protein [Patescibacteria group bacterium]|nr:DUF2304 domain-containing protein [Patescibacteria group bacterium]MBU4453142.1 DUF2304 domain-containing protein [Patescibacteria group bacterium]MCG2687351.1 DUF2304 domain-containing protein [Candidatus Parcubacteria bacterium]